MPSWRERWVALRNRWLCDPRFHKRALDCPLTRPIALARVAALFDLTAGFVYSQVLDATIRLGILEILRAGPIRRDRLAEEIGATSEALDALLKAAEALELVESLPGERVALGPQGSALLGNPGLSELVLHHSHLYADLAQSEALFRGRPQNGRLAAYWPYAGASSAGVASTAAVTPYSTLMGASLPALAEDILDAVPLRGRRRLMDVGGGLGVFLSAAASRWPHLALRLFDLPAVVEAAQRRLVCEGLSERIECVAGDFIETPLPAGADVISLVRILHDHDDTGVRRILSSARKALPSSGQLIIAEPLSGTGGRDRVAGAYFSVYLLAMGRGQPRTSARLKALLGEAGFSNVRQVATRNPTLMRVLLARP